MRHQFYISVRTTIVAICVGFLTMALNTNAQQKQIVDSNFNTWLSNTNMYNVHAKWFLSSEFHIRRTDGFNLWQQLLLRPGANFRLNQHVVFSVGYSYSLGYPYGNESVYITTPEHNSWEQVTLKHSIGKLAINHRYRFEQRFIGNRTKDAEEKYHIDGFNFSERFRYQLTAIIPLVVSKKWFLRIFDEVFITQQRFVPSGLNQNRVYAGAGFKFNKRGTVQLGFMHQLIKNSDGIHSESNYTLQCSVGYVIGKLPETNPHHKAE